MGNATNCSKPISDDLPVEAQDPFYLSNMWVQFFIAEDNLYWTQWYTTMSLMRFRKS